jgi:predicted kinase
VDATFLRRADRDQFHRLAADSGVPFVIVPFEEEQAVLLERLAARHADASEATAAVLWKQLADQQPLESDERPFCRPLGQLVSPHD